TSTNSLYTFSLHDALPICVNNAKLTHIKSFFPKLKIVSRGNELIISGDDEVMDEFGKKFELILQHFHQYNELTENNIDNLMLEEDRKSTRLNSSHVKISYA